MTSTGERVKQERLARGWSQADLAKRVTRLGHEITQDGIAKLEKRDARRPFASREIAIALGVNLDWLLEEKGPKYIEFPADDSDFPWELWKLLRPPLQKSIISLIKEYVGEKVPDKEQVDNRGIHENVNRDANIPAPKFSRGNSDKSRNLRK